MDVINAIKGRKSTRAFLNKDVNKDTIEKILETARFAPSGVNTQPWKVLVVREELKHKIGNDIINAREANILPNPDYNYYPTTWVEPYKSRRKACGLALYSSINITLEDEISRKKAWYRNYKFFDAPIGLFFFIDAKLEKGSWLDMGMFIQSVMLAARGFGLETCPEASMAEYPDIVRKNLNLNNDSHLICGMAIGYPDLHHPINQYRTHREKVDTFTTFLGFD